jgi:nuclear pore complex protein Nup155
MYPIPDRIFEQHNRAEFSTMMGLFADINHAWVTIDNACYLWDYTHPDPVLVGFEEQPHNITAVQLVYPRPGVFLPHITRLLVVATTSELMLVGVSTEAAPTGGLAVALYNIDMSVSVRGMDVNVIEGSKTGRIFFSGKCDNDIYEFTYQREEKWFQSRCGKVNHTGKGITLITPTFFTARKQQPEHTVQMAIDDSRNLLYTVSSASAIRVLHMKSSSELNLVISKSLDETLGNISHLTTPTDLISKSMRLVSICPVSAQEAARIHLVVVTSTGIRLFMSATPSYGNSSSSNAPTSMQIQHIKFPPPESSRPATTGQQPSNSTQLISGGSRGINTTSKALVNTRTASRYPPGYFFCFVSRDQQAQTDHLFVTAPDAGRIARPQETAALSRYMEYGLWLNLGSRAEDIGLSSPPFAASSSPTGFANELAVQYDKPTAEVAILTNTGVHTFRRRRLVDMFAAAIQGGGGGEGLEAEFKKFIRLYGRSETAATALAVTCGQGIDVTNESRASSINDPDILDRARKAFVEFGGKPVIDENALVGQSTPTIDMVHPSPRHDGLARYIARLVRSIWKALVAQESVTPAGGLTVSSPVSQAKLRDVQRGLTKLKEFLSANKSFIDGLAGPEALGRVSTKQEEISLQAEHRALHALTTLISNMIEGIAFVLTLFEERVEEVVLTLTNEARQQLRSLTYEGLFCSDSGRELAKELVKAIVDRNIASGSNVDTVAEALRRRCGSFCSANDVVIFKAQEQLRRASEAGSSSELARNLLNESLRLFKEVSESLSMEQLQWAVGQYLPMQFYAGAIELALSVARQSDRGNKALSWIQAGRPEQVRQDSFDFSG